MLSKSRDALIIHLFALLHAGLAFGCRALGLTDGGWDFLEPHAYEVMERIEDPEIQALHVMEG